MRMPAVYRLRCPLCGYEKTRPSMASLKCQEGHTWQGDFQSPTSLLCPTCHHLGYEKPTLCPRCDSRPRRRAKPRYGEALRHPAGGRRGGPADPKAQGQKNAERRQKIGVWGAVGVSTPPPPTPRSSP